MLSHSSTQCEDEGEIFITRTCENMLQYVTPPNLLLHPYNVILFLSLTVTPPLVTMVTVVIIMLLLVRLLSTQCGVAIVTTVTNK